MPNVLIVDDEPSFIKSIRFLLDSEKFDVETAASGREALDVARRFRPDLLIVDWMLRNSIDGIEVAERMRAKNPDLRTVVISGYPSSDLGHRVNSMPSTEFLAKPFLPDDLIAAVRRVAKSFD